MPQLEFLYLNNMTDDKELEILENIYLSEDSVRQRDLAQIVGLSLGMTNSILKRLAKKGWLSVRKVNNRNIKYIVSPEGMEAITRRSYRFFKRTIKNVVFYKEAIDSIIKSAKNNHYCGVMLIGKSDLDFIVEHSCHIHEMDFVKDESSYSKPIFHFYAESYIPDPALEHNDYVAFMQRILM